VSNSSQPGPSSVHSPRMGMLWRNRLPGRVPPRRRNETRNGANKRSNVPRADGQQTFAPVGVQAAMIRFVGRQPLRQQRRQPAAAGLKGGKPDGLEDRQQRRRLILARPPQNQRGCAQRLRPPAQRANGRLAMITQQFHRLGDQFAFVFPACGRVTPPPLRQDFRFGLLAHKIVLLLGNTDFWRNDSFLPPPPTASGNKKLLAQIGHGGDGRFSLTSDCRGLQVLLLQSYLLAFF